MTPRRRRRAGRLARLLAAATAGAACQPAAAPPPARVVLTAAPPAPAPAPPPAEDDAAIPIWPQDPTWGSRTAPATLVVFSDFAATSPDKVSSVLEHAERTYGTSKLRVVWKALPRKDDVADRTAAEAALGVFALAGGEAFWKFHGAATAGRGPLVDANLRGWALEAGVTDSAALERALASHTWGPIVDRDVALAEALDVQTAPFFLVNGARAGYSANPDWLAAAIDKALAEAKALLETGVAPASVYGVLARQHRDAAAAERTKHEEAERENKRELEASRAADAAKVYRVAIGDSPALGPATAPVTLVVFSSLATEASAALNGDLQAVRAQFGDRVRIVWKDWVWNDALDATNATAEQAAEAAREVRAERGDRAFWAVHDALLVAAQKDLVADASPATLAMNTETIVGAAVRAGAREAAVRKAIAEHAHRPAIERDEDLRGTLGATNKGLYVNGHPVLGDTDRAALVTLVEAHLPDGANVKPDPRTRDVYAELIKDGITRPDPPLQSLPKSPLPGDPGLGDTDAKVTVYEFCMPDLWCRQAHQAFAYLRERYGDRVRLVWRDRENGYMTASREAALEAFEQKGPSAFWAFQAKVYEGGLGPVSVFLRPHLDDIARDLKLDMERFVRAMDDHTHHAQLAENLESAKQLGLLTSNAGIVVVPRGSTSARVPRYWGYGMTSAVRRAVEQSMGEAR
jgi:protein-disulfide isomerase